MPTVKQEAWKAYVISDKFMWMKCGMPPKKTNSAYSKKNKGKQKSRNNSSGHTVNFFYYYLLFLKKCWCKQCLLNFCRTMWMTTTTIVVMQPQHACRDLKNSTLSSCLSIILLIPILKDMIVISITVLRSVCCNTLHKYWQSSYY